MTRAPLPLSRLVPLPWLAPLSALLLCACGPMVQIGSGKDARPQVLYTISAAPVAAQTDAATPAAATPIDTGKAVSVATPTAPGALQTLRIPVSISDTEIQYVPAASWSEQPNILFQRLLANTLAAHGISVIDMRSTGRTASRRLTGQLQNFGVDLRQGREVHLRYDATLSTTTSVHQHRFERSAQIHQVDGAEITTALNQIANAIASDVAAWVQSIS